MSDEDCQTSIPGVFAAGDVRENVFARSLRPRLTARWPSMASRRILQKSSKNLSTLFHNLYQKVKSL
ncbi:MAG: hypothetical protein ACLR23_00500 [Clostridia bacterium]